MGFRVGAMATGMDSVNLNHGAGDPSYLDVLGTLGSRIGT
ncbi:hypothetical protein VTJ04DRAFT_9098 [Mycothermus thermophilus]